MPHDNASPADLAAYMEQRFSRPVSIAANAPCFLTERHEALIDYWIERHIGDRLPAFSDIDPVEIHRLLSNLIVLDVQPGAVTDYRYRLIGEQIRRRLRANHTGRTLAESGQTRDGVVWRSLDHVRAIRSPYLSPVDYGGTDPLVKGQQDLMLPLASDGETVDTILVLIEYDLINYPARRIVIPVIRTNGGTAPAA